MIICCATLVIDDFAQNLILPMLPFYQTELGLSPSKIGIILASESVAVLVLSPLFGWLVRGIKRLGFLIVLCLTAFAMTVCLFGYARDFAWILIGRVVQGIVVAVTFPSVFLLISRVFPGAAKVRRLSQVNTLTMLIGLGAPFFSGVLLQFLGVPGAFIAVSVGVLVVAATFTLMKISTTETVSEGNTISRHSSHSELLGMISAVITMAILGFIQFLMPLQLSKELHFHSLDIGLYLFVLGVLFAVPQLFFTKVIERTHRQWFMFVGLMAAGLVLLASVHASGWSLVLLTMSISILLSAAFATSLVVMGSSNSASQSFGLLEAGISGGLILGTFGGGLAYGKYGLLSLSVFGIFTLIVSITLLIPKLFCVISKGGELHDKNFRE